ncbi:MAG: PfkB family carbohydrate kinase [SAR202 cluster bacterium]|nr:PfkB family carbohydrate kinase [SAR202 cluster bacterium]
MLKVDKVDNRPISEDTLAHLKNSISSYDGRAIVFSDFRHGVFNRDTVEQLKAVIPEGPIKVADSQVASRWGNILDFEGFDLITPNEKEARFTLGDQDSVIRPLSLDLYRRADCKTLILKMGDRGIMTYRAPSPEVGSFFSIDSFAGNVVDAVGAGDALLAYATLSLATTGSEVVASILGSLAAAVACEREGNMPVGYADVLARINVVERQSRYE